MAVLPSRTEEGIIVLVWNGCSELPMGAMLKFTAFAILLLISGSAHGEPTTGELFAQCEAYERPRVSSAQDTSSAKCLAYFSAVHQLAYLYLDGRKVLNFVCVPNDGPDTAQLIQVFMAYVRANPHQDRRRLAVVEVTRALARTFPCKDHDR
jgi:Rap1a immunity proteins